MTPAATIDGDAFRVLFPEEFYERHLSQGTRPDGRALAESRPLTIALGAIGRSDVDDGGLAPSASASATSPPCDGSALVRCGGTAAVAAVTFEVAAASEAHSPTAGAVSVSVDLPPLSSSEARPGGGGATSSDRSAIAAAVLSDLRSCGSVDEAGGSLCIERGVAVFVARVDVTFLSCDGGERCVALLAAASALADARLPEVEVSGGNVARVTAGKKKRGARGGGEGTGASSSIPSTSPLALGSLLLSLPVSSSLAVRGSTAVADPNSRETSLAHSIVDVVVRAGDGAVLRVEGGSRGGGAAVGGDGAAPSSSSSVSGLVPLEVLGRAVSLGRARAAEASEVLSAALEEAKRRRRGG